MHCGIAQIHMKILFSKFVEEVEKIIQENYKFRIKNDEYWQKRRTDDQIKAITESMKGIHA